VNPPAPVQRPRREPLIDALKVIASQLIVLHHLAFYGPMADHAAPLLPSLAEFLAGPARFVVQVFLVVGGFLAARQLAPGGLASTEPALVPRLLERYLRLVLPLMLALLLAVAAASLARHWMPGHPSVPGVPEPLQLLLHLLLAQDLFGVEALSAGLWYVAIDFQLFAGLLGLLWACRWVEGPHCAGRQGRLAPWVVVGVVGASALGFNRDADWDVAAPYFAAAYGLGVLAAWARSMPLAWAAGLLLVGLALVIEPRGRLLLAGLVATLLWIAQGLRQPPADTGVPEPTWRTLLAAAGASSYAVFLLHFPMGLVINAVYTQFVPARPWPQLTGVLLAWGLSAWVGWLFHGRIEQPLVRWASRRRGLWLR
jgi:peptidoglycan/LPS O-acetylase OafA/YrhL